MKYKIVVVGKIKEKFYREAIDEYVKRISRFGNVEIAETDECFFNGIPNQKEIDIILDGERKNILPKLEGYVIALDIGGKQLSSEDIACALDKQKQQYSTFTFVIGGSYGLSDQIKDRANLRLSFGKITLPHQLCRVVLCEQIYRACCIQNNVPYHK